MKKILSCFICLVCCLQTINLFAQITFDLIISNGKIFDHQTKTFKKGSIAIHADTIAFIGKISKKNKIAKRIINAKGYVVSPGFIDPHTHALNDLVSEKRKANLNFLHQGVTTVFVGNDGRGTPEVGAMLNGMSTNGIGTNVGMFVGHGKIRRLVMNMSDAEPTEKQLENMKKLVKKGMSEGAFGLSTGLYYAPNSYASTEEVIELTKIAASYQGIYESHIRDESSYSVGLLKAIEEVIEIGQETGIPVHVSHIKALGVDVWDKSEEVIKMIEKAQKEGIKITADQYPYEASGTSLANALVPRWVMANSPDFLKKFDDKTLKTKIIEEMTENLRKRGGAGSLLISRTEIDELRGKTLEELATKWAISPVEAAIKILKLDGVGVASFNMKTSDVENFMKQPWVMTCSDGTNGHPRKYGSFPRKINKYVRADKVLKLEEMIYKSSTLTAETLKIKKRGRLAEGYFADITLFKPKKVKDNATFQASAEYAEGMTYVIVNGKVVIDKGVFSGELAGKPLRLNRK